MEQKYFTIPTAIGREKMLAHSVAQTKLDVVDYAVGDGNGEYYQPDGTMTALRNEQWRGPVTDIQILPEAKNVIRFSTFIDAQAGGFSVREMAVFDQDGDMIAVSNTPLIEKVGLIEGVPTGLVLHMLLAVEDTACIHLSVDPHIVGATKEDVERLRLDMLAALREHDDSTIAHPLLNPNTYIATVYHGLGLIPLGGLYEGINAYGAGGYGEIEYGGSELEGVPVKLMPTSRNTVKVFAPERYSGFSVVMPLTSHTFALSRQGESEKNLTLVLR